MPMPSVLTEVGGSGKETLTIPFDALACVGKSKLAEILEKQSKTQTKQACLVVDMKKKLVEGL